MALKLLKDHIQTELKQYMCVGKSDNDFKARYLLFGSPRRVARYTGMDVTTLYFNKYSKISSSYKVSTR